MKKLVLTAISVVMIIALAVVLAACSNATTQGQLVDAWRPYEKYVYEVKLPDSSVSGEYSVEIKRLTGQDVSVGSYDFTNANNGYLVTGKLQVDNTVIDTVCFFKLIKNASFLIPEASYRKITVDGQDVEIAQGIYDGANFNYSLTANGKTSNGTVSLKSPFYDNIEFHQVLRGASDLSSSFSFSFQVPIVSATEIAAADLTARVTAEEKVTVTYGEVDCYKMALSRSTKVEGASHTLYYAKNNVTVDGWNLKNVLVKFEEPSKTGNIVYELKSISLTDGTQVPDEGEQSA